MVLWFAGKSAVLPLDESGSFFNRCQFHLAFINISDVFFSLNSFTTFLSSYLRKFLSANDSLGKSIVDFLNDCLLVRR